VLSTYHAGSASEALTRLMDVIGQNPLFVSAIRLVMAQRLIRKLDDATKIPRDPTPQELKRIQEVIAGLPAEIPKPDLTGLKLYNPGSSVDNPYGFQGQIAIREQFRMTGEIRRLLEQHDSVLSAPEIEAAASQSGMRTMLQDGILQVVAGVTTLEEVYRVVG
jgi:type II secretory ATPase GspE/PulE/Tfp pilus assembly ATPase PilB-like protein